MQEGLLDWLQQLPLRVKPGPRGPRMPSSAISVRPPLIPDWPREPDASAKEAQVGKSGRVPLEGEMALLRGRHIAPETIISMDQRPVMH